MAIGTKRVMAGIPQARRPSTRNAPLSKAGDQETAAAEASGTGQGSAVDTNGAHKANGAAQGTSESFPELSDASGQEQTVSKRASRNRYAVFENKRNACCKQPFPHIQAPHLQEEQEEELQEEVAAAPEEALREEQKLREKREAEEERERNAALERLKEAGRDKGLNTETWSHLDTLLTKAGMYTQFLTEQLAEFDQKMQGSLEQKREQAEADADAERKGKRKSTPARAVSAKKAKTDKDGSPTAATQEMLPLMKGEMRTYQLKGVRWLMSLYQNGLNGILADQMGLGKTVQTIGFLSHLRSKGVFGPFLIIAPLSTLPNWVSEFERWSPSHPVLLYHGSKQERAELRRTRMSGSPKSRGYPAIVTSFEMVIADAKLLSRHKYKYLVVDEGHRLKNYNCRLIRELRTIPTEQRLLLSGTPLQNNLGELWSLLNFVQPDVFSDLADFESWFDFGGLGQAGGDAAILAQEQRNKVVSKLHEILKPFLLRRVKADVETSLPAKMEVVLFAEMAQAQRKLNDELLLRTLKDKSTNERSGTSQRVSRLNNMLMQMRKVANHPDLVTAEFEKDNLEYPSAAQLMEECGKMALLDRMLTRLHARGHKVLIFSQMTKMLDLLHAYLEERGHKPARIDGSIPWQERQESMRAFNSEPDMFVFLLSTRAGGLGINLTAADTCIIYDSDWNPHQDLQAMDRCHRIGQTRPVLVFRLATAGSVEGKLLARAGSKLLLEKLVIRKGGSVLDIAENSSGGKKTTAAGLTSEELVELLKTSDEGKDVAQSGVVDDKMLEKLLDRSHLSAGKKHPYPSTGVGYQVVQQQSSTGLLKGVA